MKYGHLSQNELSKGLLDTARELETEAKFMREVANGGFKLPKDDDERLRLMLSHADIILSLKQRYEDLSRALSAKIGGS